MFKFIFFSLRIILQKEGNSDSPQVQNRAITKIISNNKDNYYNDDTENISRDITFITKVLAVDSSQEVEDQLKTNFEQSSDILESVDLNDDVDLEIVENFGDLVTISEEPTAEIEINYEPEPPTTTTTTTTATTTTTTTATATTTSTTTTTTTTGTTTTTTTAMTTTTTTTTTTTISEEQNTESTSQENSIKGLA